MCHLVGDSDNWGGHASEAGDIWEICVLSSQFCYEPQNAPKIKFIYKGDQNMVWWYEIKATFI